MYISFKIIFFCSFFLRHFVCFGCFIPSLVFGAHSRLLYCNSCTQILFFFSFAPVSTTATFSFRGHVLDVDTFSFSSFVVVLSFFFFFVFFSFFGTPTFFALVYISFFLYSFPFLICLHIYGYCNVFALLLLNVFRFTFATVLVVFGEYSLQLHTETERWPNVNVVVDVDVKNPKQLRFGCCMPKNLRTRL